MAPNHDDSTLNKPKPMELSENAKSAKRKHVDHATPRNDIGETPAPKRIKNVVHAPSRDSKPVSTPRSETTPRLNTEKIPDGTDNLATISQCTHVGESNKENKCPQTFKIPTKRATTTYRSHPYKPPFKSNRVAVMTSAGFLDHCHWDFPCFDQRSAALDVMGLRKISYLGGPEKETKMLCKLPDNANKKYVLTFYGSRTSERFLRELEAVREIRHPYILTPRSFRMVKSISFSVSHYLANGSLATHIGNLEIVPIVKYFIKIANALSFLHSRQVYHQDLRPENIMIDDNDNPMICDFDMAENLNPGKSVSNKRLKTEADVQYARYYGEKVDSYSLGVVLHCMMFETEYHELYDYFGQASIAKIPPGCQVFPMLKQTILNLVTPQWSDRWNADRVLWLFAQHHQLLLRFCGARKLEEIDPIFAKGVRGAENKQAKQNNSKNLGDSSEKSK